MIRGAAAALLLGAAAGMAQAQDSCTLAQPPAEAGESTVNEALVKVHPRRAAISASFTGCQTAWETTPDGVEIVMRIHVRQGRIVGLTLPPSTRCVYGTDAAQPDQPAECPKEPPALLKSSAPGCISKPELRNTPACLRPD